MTLTQSVTDTIVQHLISKIGSLELLYLFGSQVQGTADLNSDVDLAYHSIAKLSSTERYELAQELACLLNTDVDLIDLDTAGEVLRKEAVLKGHLIYGDTNLSDEYAVRVMRDYQDHKYRVKDIEAMVFEGEPHARSVHK